MKKFSQKKVLSKKVLVKKIALSNNNFVWKNVVVRWYFKPKNVLVQVQEKMWSKNIFVQKFWEQNKKKSTRFLGKINLMHNNFVHKISSPKYILIINNFGQKMLVKINFSLKMFLLKKNLSKNNGKKLWSEKFSFQKNLVPKKFHPKNFSPKKFFGQKIFCPHKCWSKKSGQKESF